MSKLCGDVGDGRVFGQQAACVAVAQVIDAMTANSGEAEDAGKPLTNPSLVEKAALSIYENQIGHIAPFLLERLSFSRSIECAHATASS